MKFYHAIPLALWLAACFAARQTTPAKETSSIGKIIRLDPAFDAPVPKDAEIEKVASGSIFTEGPAWRPEGVPWFSDVAGNLIRSFTPAGQVKVVMGRGAGRETAVPDLK